MPADLHVVLGRTGGFAGRTDGYTIRQDGTVLQWEGKYVEEHVQKQGRIPPDQVEALWRQVQAADYFGQDQQDVDNMTVFMNITAEGRSHRVSWPLRPGEDPPDGPLQRLYGFCREAAANALLPPSSN